MRTNVPSALSSHKNSNYAVYKCWKKKCCDKTKNAFKMKSEFHKSSYSTDLFSDEDSGSIEVQIF